MDLELLHFPFSHFNEKARWALDYKGLPHRRRCLLPGLHMREVKRLTGQTQTPCLCIDGTWIVGSAHIVAELDRLAPEPPLFPSDPAERRQVETIIARFDDDWAPRIRRVVLSALLDESDYLARMFATGQPATKRLFYRALMPMAKGLIRKGNGITGEGSIQNGHSACGKALSFVAENAGEHGYLVGGRFTAADLTAAAILSPLADPPDCDMTRPRPVPEKVAVMRREYASHPGMAWVLDMYLRHRAAHQQEHSAG